MITVVLGPSGIGKTVLLKHFTGLMFPDSGDIRVHGRSVPKMRKKELLEFRKRVGILLQDGALFGSLNVFENVAYPLRNFTRMGNSEIEEIVHERLASVGLAGEDQKMPIELSGGMKKRAGLARALVLKPDIVLVDEPDTGLDPVRTALLCKLIQEIHAETGGTYVIVTHDLSTAWRIGEYIALIWRGKIVESGDRQQMFSSTNPFVRQFFSEGELEGPLGMD
jgi:phospholipid/cholesterol/gamma-HCH transport system ATP-binding protein